MGDIDIWGVEAELKKIDCSKFSKKELSSLLKNTHNYINNFLIFFPSHYFNRNNNLPIDEMKDYILSIKKQMKNIEKQLLDKKKFANKYDAKVEAFMWAVNKNLIHFSNTYTVDSVIDMYFSPGEAKDSDEARISVNKFCLHCIEVCKSLPNTQLYLFSIFDFCPICPIIVENKDNNIIVKLDENRIKDRLDENTAEGQLIIEMGGDIENLKEYYSHLIDLFGGKEHPLNLTILNSFGITDYNQMYKDFKKNIVNFDTLDNLSL